MNTQINAKLISKLFKQGPVAQSVASQIADPGFVSSIPYWLHTLVEMDHLVIFLLGLLSVTMESMCIEYWLTT